MGYIDEGHTDVPCIPESHQTSSITELTHKCDFKFGDLQSAESWGLCQASLQAVLQDIPGQDSKPFPAFRKGSNSILEASSDAAHLWLKESRHNACLTASLHS